MWWSVVASKLSFVERLERLELSSSLELRGSASRSLDLLNISRL